MMTIDEIKKIYTVGAEFGYYYGNGTPIGNGKTTVTRVTDKSCWTDGSRSSWNTIKDHFEKGIYRVE